MPVHYSLRENNLTTNPTDYAAQVSITSSADLTTIVDRIMQQGSTVTRADVLAVLENALEVTEAFLVEGYRVNFGGLVDLYPRLRGKFLNITDSYDSSRHKLDVGASPGARVRKYVRNTAHVVKLESSTPSPSLLEFIDMEAGRNDLVTQGGIGELNGKRLQFDRTKEDEGVFFVPSGTGGGTLKKVEIIQRLKPSQLVFQVPPTLAAGIYILEVRARVNGGKTIRKGQLPYLLTAL